jgi:hypothetical protein
MARRKKNQSAPKPIPGVPANDPYLAHTLPITDAAKGFSLDFGLPGLKQTVTVVRRTPSGPLGPPQGSPGKYRAIVTLQRPGFNLLPEGTASFEGGLVGDSHLAMTPDHTPPDLSTATELEIDFVAEETGQTFSLAALANEKGFLQKVRLNDFDAQSFADAHTIMAPAIGTVLSQFSIQLDVPLRVCQLDLTEVSTGSVLLTWTNPSLDIPLVVAPRLGSQEFRAYSSLYREGLGTDSPLYQFLCFYKIAEGVKGRRVKAARDAKNKGQTAPPMPLEVVPEKPEDLVPWLQTIFQVSLPWTPQRLDAIFLPEIRGRAFSDVLSKDKAITALRNRISHSLAGSSADDVVDLDQASIHAEAQRFLPILKCIARKMLRNEFSNEFLPHLAK